MIKNISFFIILITLISCGTAKQVVEINDKHLKVDKIIENANTYIGTKYKYGGIDKKGIDCSGLIYNVYYEEKVKLPRISRDIALKGKTVHLKNVRKGDLLFFITGNKNRINHVGMVTNIIRNEIFFIHASSSRGVVISSMSESYYKNKFKIAKRIL